MKRTLTAIALVAMATSAHCQGTSREELIRQEQFARQWHKEHDEEMEHLGKATAALASMQKTLNDQESKVRIQCLRVFSSESFCHCVSVNSPLMFNFVEFIAVNAFEEGGKEIVSSGYPIDAIVNARLAKQKCIKEANPFDQFDAPVTVTTVQKKN